MKFLIAFAMCSSLASPLSAQATGVDGAHLALDYTIYREIEGNIVRSAIGEPVVLITTSHYIRLEDVQQGRAFSLVDLDRGGSPLGLELVDIGGLPVITAVGQPNAFNWFLFKPRTGEALSMDGNYELTVHYDQLSTWGEGIESEDGATVTPNPTQLDAAVRVKARELPAGKRVNNFGFVVANDGSSKLDAQARSKGLRGLLSDLDLELTPQLAEGSNELALSYKAGYEVDRKRFGSRSFPGTFTLDFSAEGRISSESANSELTGYSSGDLSARGMWLLGSSRYYPVGVRVAAGYEGGDDFSDVEATVTGEAVVSVPYIGDVLEGWQELLEFERAFAPPYMSFAYVGSGAEVAGDEQDRLVFEAGWIAPVAETWDVNLRWQHFDFTKGAVRDEDLFEAHLTHYPGGDLSQGLRLTFEEGYRAAVGDVGSTLLLGYMLSF